MAKTAQAQVIQLPKLNIQYMDLTVEGDTPLISNAWSPDAREAMLGKQTGKAPQQRKPKDAQRCFEYSLYSHPEGGYGIPGRCFKSAAVNACSQIKGLTKVETRGAFHVVDDMVKIKGKPTMREDMVRNATGVADIRYRGEFKEWSATFTVRFNASVMSAEQIIYLFEVAGFASGVGDWRPQRNGSNGMFHVKHG